MLRQLRTMIGPAAGDAIYIFIRSLGMPRLELSTTIIGAAGLLFVASGLFNHLRDSLNTIWEVTARPGHPLRGYFFSRLLAMIMALCLGAVALVGLSLTIGMEAAVRNLGSFLPGEMSVFGLRAAH